MSTKPRIIVPQVVYQITAEGTEEIQLFGKDVLKKFFIDQLARISNKYELDCYAFSLTANQYYLLVRSSEQSISIAMQNFNSVIAKKFNKTEKRHGTVFGSRFSALVIEQDKLKELVSFIHLQPVANGECSLEQLDNYKWSGHYSLIGNKPPNFLNVQYVLDLFDMSEPVKNYQDYIKQFTSNKQNEQLIKYLKDANSGKLSFHKREVWVLGKPQFVKQILELDSSRRARIARYVKENVSMERIVEEVTKSLCLPAREIFRQGLFDVKSTARELFAYMGKFRFDFSGAQLARHLNVTESAVSRMISRFNSVECKDFFVKMVNAEFTSSPLEQPENHLNSLY